MQEVIFKGPLDLFQELSLPKCCIFCLCRLLRFWSVPGRSRLGCRAGLPDPEQAPSPGGGAAHPEDHPHRSSQTQTPGTAPHFLPSVVTSPQLAGPALSAQKMHFIITIMHYCPARSTWFNTSPYTTHHYRIFLVRSLMHLLPLFPSGTLESCDNLTLPPLFQFFPIPST